MSAGRVYFVGGGPDAADLLTLRGARAIAAADVVVWGRSLLSEEVITEHARPTAELAPWPPLSADGLLEVYDRARDNGLAVVRVYGGDPTIYGWVHEEIASVTERGLAYEVIPGVTSMAAAAAAAGCILSGGMLILARREGWRPLPPGESIRDYAPRHDDGALHWRLGNRRSSSMSSPRAATTSRRPVRSCTAPPGPRSASCGARSQSSQTGSRPTSSAPRRSSSSVPGPKALRPEATLNDRPERGSAPPGL